MEYTYFIIENSNQFQEIKFISPVPLHKGDQIEVKVALYEVILIRHICAAKRDATVKKDEYKTVCIEAHVRNLK